ncbi:MAG: hypothetical protein H0S84_02595 [Bacteroidales bacterium]|jgi:hypothetical protein|nr:hypothetical protein [Bacteroidales bacterium]
MKINKKNHKSIHFLALLFSFSLFFIQQNSGYSQCASINCDGTTTSGLYPSAIGRYTSATGNYSFAGGLFSESSGQSSFSFGNRAKALGGSSIALGQFIDVTASTAIGIGYGYDIDSSFVNNIPWSLMIGIGSTKPTFYVGRSSSVNRTGRIGIGNVTSPQAKLHIRADEGEDASLLLEPTGSRQLAKLQFLDALTGISVDPRIGLNLFTDLETMQFSAPQFTFEGPVKVEALEVNGAYSLPLNQGNPGEFLSHNGTWAVPSGGGGGSSYWQPSGSTIYYNGGNVGIGTSDTKGYKLGVNGKIIATEVVVKYFSQWPDYVFEPTYPLMPLSELQEFVQTHRHLPDMPPAQQVAETGVPVGEMNALLLKKVEELTLYVLQQQQAMEQQQKEIELLKQKLQD